MKMVPRFQWHDGKDSNNGCSVCVHYSSTAVSAYVWGISMVKALIDGDAISYIIGYASESIGYQYVSTFKHENSTPKLGLNLDTNEPTITHDGENFTFEFMNMTERQVREKLRELSYFPQGELTKKTYVASHSHSEYLTKLLMDQILTDVGTEEFQVYLTSDDKSNFRFKLAETQPYKGNRKDSRKPYNLQAIRQFLIDRYHADVIYGMEADDALGMAQFNTRDTIICDNDKDTWMIPGNHYNIKTREFFTTSDPGELELVNQRKKLRGGGILWFYAQMLLGDTADNIPGLEGYGPVKVYNLLNGVQNEVDMLQIVRNQYILKQCIDRLPEIGGLLWILRTCTDQKKQHIQQMLGQSI